MMQGFGRGDPFKQAGAPTFLAFARWAREGRGPGKQARRAQQSMQTNHSSRPEYRFLL
ncbi:MAG: hypothetical protein NVSMB6_08200 [Burkholderiaceae bacterium]